MKKLLLTTGVVLAMAAAQGQVVNTNAEPPVLEWPIWTAIQTVGAATNWTAVPYGLYRTESKTFGAGLAMLYNFNGNLATGIGLDYMDRELWMPSAQVQLQIPVVSVRGMTLTPFGYTGISTVLSRDEGDEDPDYGQVVGIFGAGAALKIWGEQSGRHLSLFGALEKRTEADGDWVRFGVAYRF